MISWTDGHSDEIEQKAEDYFQERVSMTMKAEYTDVFVDRGYVGRGRVSSVADDSYSNCRPLGRPCFRSYFYA